MENTLVFEEGKYGPKIETLSDYDSSIFKDIYDKGFKCLNEILVNEEQYDNNNIIAFIGERGGGKTSCMMSFEKILLEGLKEKSEIFKKILTNEINSPNNSEQEKKTLIDISFDNIKNNEDYREFLLEQIEKANVFKKKYSFFNYSYTTLDTIDPSFFTEKSNILEIIIAILFKNFKEKDKSNEDISLQKTISRCFKNVYKNISIINNKYNFDGENYDKLQDLSASITLKKEIRELITKYLEFMNKNSKQNKLIIKIDDIDLNIKYSYEMVEQIRKYLIQDNIIILMAVKLDQLEKIIRVNYIKSFDSKIEDIDLNYGQMSYRYLEKLIPQNRRLHLINLENQLKNIIIKFSENNENTNIETGVRQLIFKKLRILFLNDNVKNNPIVPKNLRFLINFINIFIQLEKIEKTDNNAKNPNLIRDEKRKLFKKNIVAFDNYFFNGWLGNNLTIENAKIIEELHNKPVEAKNKYIVTKIVETLNKIIKNENNDNKLKRINEGKFISTNVSLGDVLENINNLEKVVVDTEHENFIVAIKSLYSRYIYDYYLDYRKKERDSEESLEYSDFEIFLGGEVILSKNLLYNSEIFEKINLTKFHDELKCLFENKLNIIQLIKNINGSSSKNSILEKLKTNLIDNDKDNNKDITPDQIVKEIKKLYPNKKNLSYDEIKLLINDKDEDKFWREFVKEEKNIFNSIFIQSIIKKLKRFYIEKNTLNKDSDKLISLFKEIELLNSEINKLIRDTLTEKKMSSEEIELTNSEINKLIRDTLTEKKMSSEEIELTNLEINKLIRDTLTEKKMSSEEIELINLEINKLIRDTLTEKKISFKEIELTNSEINKLIREKLTEKKMSSEEIELINSEINKLISKKLTEKIISSDDVELINSEINKLIREKLTEKKISYEEIELIIKKINEVIHNHLNKLTYETPLSKITKKIEFIVFLTYFFKDIHPESKRLNSSKDFKNLGRLRDETFYNGKLNFNNKIDTSYNVEFDIFSPLFFGLSEYRVLSRYSYIDGVSDLYNFVKDINDEIENEEHKININPFKNIHLRNIELIEKGFESLVPPNSTDRFDIIESLYKQLGKFKLSTDIVTINYKDQYEELLSYIKKDQMKTKFNEFIFSCPEESSTND